MGNYFYPYFVFCKLAKQYNQDVEILEEYSCNKGRYTIVIDEFYHPTLRKSLFEYSSDGSLSREVFENTIIDHYKPQSVIFLDSGSITWGKNGELRFRQEEILNSHDIVFCRFDKFYDKQINEWLLVNREQFSDLCKVGESRFRDQMAEMAKNSVGIHIRYFKIIRAISPPLLKKLLTSIIGITQERFGRCCIWIFTDAVHNMKSLLGEIDKVQVIDVPLDGVRRDFYELFLFSECKYRIAFDTTSFSFWGRMLAESDIENDLIFSVMGKNCVERFFTKRILRLNQDSFIYNCYLKHVLAKYVRCTKKWAKRLEINENTDDCNAKAFLSGMELISAELEEVLLNHFNVYERESYHRRKAFLNDDLESHLEYYDDLYNNNSNHNVLIEKCYIYNRFGHITSDSLPIDCYNEQKLSKAHFYIFIKLDAELFTCVTDYLENIGITLAYMGYNVSFVVCNSISKYANYYQLRITEDYLNALNTYKKCKYIFYDNYIKLRNDGLYKILMYKDTEASMISNHEGIKVLFCNCKWYDGLQQICNDNNNKIYENVDLIVSTNPDNLTSFEDRIIVVEKDNTIREAEVEIPIEKREEMDDWTMQVVQKLKNRLANRER